jgi:putative Mn2+ efflux pump MntP
MGILGYIFLGVVVASNNLAVSFALGSLKTKNLYWRIVLVFTVFETLLPLLGMLIGKHFASLINTYATPVASVILLLLGGYLIASTCSKNDEPKKLVKKITSWTGLILLAIGLGIDNLLVGFSLGLKNGTPLMIAFIIGTVAFIFVSTGLKIGKYIRKEHRKIADLAAGMLLVLLAVLTYFNVI